MNKKAYLGFILMEKAMQILAEEMDVETLDPIKNDMDVLKHKANLKLESYKLGDLQPGDVFGTEIGRFIVRKQMKDATGVVLIQYCRERKKKCFYINDDPVYGLSDIKKYYDTKILTEMEVTFGAENILDDTINFSKNGLVSDCVVHCKVHPPTLEEWHQCLESGSKIFNEIEVRLEDYWTCTAWENSPLAGVWVVGADRNTYRTSKYGKYGVVEAVACLLSSSITVIKEV